MAKFQPIPSGRLRQVVQIQTVSRSKGTTGETIESWATDATKHRAHIEPSVVSEQMAAMQMTPDLTHVVTMRPVSGLESVKRLLVNLTRVFEIVSVIDMELRGRETVLLCKELL